MKKYDFIERSAFFSLLSDEYAASQDAAAEAGEPAVVMMAKAEEPAAAVMAKAEEPAADAMMAKAEEPAAAMMAKAEEPAAVMMAKAEEPAAAMMAKAEEPVAVTMAKAEEPAAGTEAKAEEPASRPIPMKPRSLLVAALNEKGVLVLGANTMLSDVPDGVRRLALFMAENFDGIAPLLTAMRSAYCVADPSKRGRFWYALREQDDPDLLADLAARLEYAGCLNECKITRTSISGRVCIAPVVNAFVIGRHAEMWSHSVTRDVAARLAARLGTDWEVLSNAVLTLPGGERAEADELLRVGDKVFCVEVKTQQKNVDLDRFHHVGDVLTGNDPTHLLLLHMRANDEQLEMLRYFHRFHAANSHCYEQALERMILEAHGMRMRDAA